MSLNQYKVATAIAVADLDGTRRFYEETLGLEPSDEYPDEMVYYRCAEGTSLMIYNSPAHAGKATATMAGWEVGDLDAEMADLRSRGLEFERYGEDSGVPTDENGVFESDGMRVAWFKDPEGNTFAIND